jgi:hypothetical protein
MIRSKDEKRKNRGYFSEVETTSVGEAPAIVVHVRVAQHQGTSSRRVFAEAFQLSRYLQLAQINAAPSPNATLCNFV